MLLGKEDGQSVVGRAPQTSGGMEQGRGKKAGEESERIPMFLIQKLERLFITESFKHIQGRETRMINHHVLLIQQL